MKKLFLAVSLLMIITNLQAQQAVKLETTDSPTLTQEAQEALDFHNKVRADVGVAPLTWSAELTKYAQNWANYLVKQGCQFRHRGSGDEEGKSYGENIAKSSGNYSLLEASKNWYSEISDFTNVPLDNSNWNIAGHYSQMVWKNTTQVGVASAKCSNGSTIVVANYNPPGNYMGQKAY